jgi:type IV secretion system protein TrbB
MLRTAMGSVITGWLEDPAVVEIMRNPDGRLWIDSLTGRASDTGKRLSAKDGERIVRLVVHQVGAEVHPGSPPLSAELAETGERVEGLIPPIVAAPAFAIRKPAVAIFPLADYARAGIMTAEQGELLCDAVSSTERSLRRARRNGV